MVAIVSSRFRPAIIILPILIASGKPAACFTPTMGCLFQGLRSRGDASCSLEAGIGRSTSSRRIWAGSIMMADEGGAVAVGIDPFDAVRARMKKESHQLLVENVDPSTVNALDLLEASIPEMSRPAAMKGYEREGGVRTLPCLTSEECKKLRDFVDETTQFRWHGPNARANVAWNTRIDSVDKCPDYQINLYPSDLCRIVGEEGYKRIWSIPLGLEGKDCSAELEPEQHTHKRLGIFVRKYTLDSRPFIPFHVDTNWVTGNVAINGDDEYEGGNLLVVSAGKVSTAVRKEGDATVHDNTVAHGVSSMMSGTRYSLILFFDKE